MTLMTQTEVDLAHYKQLFNRGVGVYLRAISDKDVAPNGRPRLSHYNPDDPEDAKQWADQQQAGGKNVYHSSEQLKAGDRPHKLKASDIERKRGFIIDWDIPVGPATDEVRAAVRESANATIEKLDEMAITPESVVDTGGGIQIGIRCDLPPTPETSKLLEAFILLFKPFENEFAKLDTCGKDILRLARVAGTTRYKHGTTTKGDGAIINADPTTMSADDFTQHVPAMGVSTATQSTATQSNYAACVALLPDGIPSDFTLDEIQSVIEMKAPGCYLGRVKVHGDDALSLNCVREGKCKDSNVVLWIVNGMIKLKCFHATNCDIGSEALLNRYDVNREDVSRHYQAGDRNAVYDRLLALLSPCETKVDGADKLIIVGDVTIRITKQQRAFAHTKTGLKDLYVWATKNRPTLAGKMIAPLVGDGETLAHDERLARQLMTLYELRLYGGQIFQFNGTGYENWSDEQTVEAKKALHSVADVDRQFLLTNYGADTKKQEFTDAKVKSILTTLRGMLPKKTEFDSGKINYNNGVFLIGSDELVGHGPEHFIGPAHPYNFDSSATSEDVDLFLMQTYAGQPEQLRLIKQIFGVIHASYREHERIFLLLGKARAGKTTVKDLCSCLAVKQTELKATSYSSPFGLQKAVGATLITTAELEGFSPEGIATLKAISGGEAVDVNRKKIAAIDVVLDANLLFQSNKIPQLNDSSAAILSRLIVVLHSHAVLEANRDCGLKKRLTNAKNMAYVARLAREGFADFVENGFAVNPHADSLVESLVENTDPLSGFLSECCKLGQDLTIKRDDLYLAYIQYLDELGADAKPSRQDFAKSLRIANNQVTGVRVRENGKRFYTWRGIQLKGNSNV